MVASGIYTAVLSTAFWPSTAIASDSSGVIGWGIWTLLAAIIIMFSSVIWYMWQRMRRLEAEHREAMLSSHDKSGFLANISHELRTPLNAIIGFSEMLESDYFGSLSEKQRERVHDIHLCGNHLLHLINDILDFSKGSAGKMELQEELFDLHALMQETIRIMREKSTIGGVTITTKEQRDLQPIWADKRKIRQILLNLLSNAIKYSEAGDTITIYTQILADGSLLLSVEDTGVGMAKEDIPKALSAFGQVRNGHQREGTGLGLPLCQLLTELHDGKLRMESALGKGTVVHIWLPAARISKSGTMPTISKEAKKQRTKTV